MPPNPRRCTSSGCADNKIDGSGRSTTMAVAAVESSFRSSLFLSAFAQKDVLVPTTTTRLPVPREDDADVIVFGTDADSVL